MYGTPASAVLFARCIELAELAIEQQAIDLTEPAVIDQAAEAT